MLEGLRVVEMGDSMAVQMCGLLLAQLGADVLKVEPPGGEQSGLWKRGTAAFANLNRGKRSLLLDPSAPAGIAELLRRLEGADVFLHRLTPVRAHALGLDDAALLGRFAHLVVCGITGSPHGHPDAERSDDELLVAARLGELYENDGHRGPSFTATRGGSSALPSLPQAASWRGWSSACRPGGAAWPIPRSCRA